KALDGDACAVQIDAGVFHGSRAHHKHATSGGFNAAQAAAQIDGLSGNNARCVGAGIVCVAVEHPGHDLAVGVDIGSRDISVGADDHADFRDVPAGNALEFGW